MLSITWDPVGAGPSLLGCCTSSENISLGNLVEPSWEEYIGGEDNGEENVKWKVYDLKKQMLITDMKTAHNKNLIKVHVHCVKTYIVLI